MRRWAVIPARGGSKRLPGKNILLVQGRPMMASTIEAAYGTDLFERVIVSTEDPEIAKVAARCGAEVSQRPEALATDTASTVDVMIDLLDREPGGADCDILCTLLATALLRGVEDIRGVVELIEPGQCNFSLAVTTYWFPPYQALWRDAAGVLTPMWPELIDARTQEFAHLRVDNGSTYAAWIPAFREERTYYGRGLRGYEMPRLRSVDIDLPEDLRLAEILMDAETL